MNVCASYRNGKESICEAIGGLYGAFYQRVSVPSNDRGEKKPGRPTTMRRHSRGGTQKPPVLIQNDIAGLEAVELMSDRNLPSCFEV